MLKILLRIVKYFFIVIIFLALYPYLTCPFYKYPEVKPFSGSFFYNPYSDIDSAKWLKANFHAHTLVWMGTTAGYNSETPELVEKYKELSYDITGISDYQKINRFQENNINFIPVYEHGYGLFKNHQLSIGAEKILWKEYLFFQNFHHKQNIIEELNEGNNLVAVNHPLLRNAYDEDDLKNLRGFRLLEVINYNFYDSFELWDAALSAGNVIFCLANDDSHDIHNPRDFGFGFNMINSKSNTKAGVIDALRNGKSFGVELKPQGDLSAAMKLKQTESLPVLRSCIIKNDSLFMSFSKEADKIQLIGQNGRSLTEKKGANVISYKILPEDTYIRAEIRQNDSGKVILNPVIRYDGTSLGAVLPQTDILKTWIFRAVILFVILSLVFIYIRRRNKKRNQ